MMLTLSGGRAPRVELQTVTGFGFVCFAADCAGCHRHGQPDGDVPTVQGRVSLVDDQ